MTKIKLALIQNVPSFNAAKNIERALELIEEAAINGGADLIALPEMFYHPFELSKLKELVSFSEQVHEEFSAISKRLKIHLCTGTFVTSLGDRKLGNSAFLYGPDGKILLSYQKNHLFDVSYGGLDIRESAVFTHGDHISSADTPLGNIGIAVCYDIRFPELFRKLILSGAELVLVPSVFNQVSGPAHWNMLTRIRAVDNQIFLAGISQGRNMESAYQAYGHSIIISPWGEVLAEALEGEEIIYADLDPAQLKETRERLPLLKHRREDLYY
ncbi:MAG: carbon-nitrogen hydrolase family protein [Chitinispirillia bacterium]|nr:carbon-nitrogen hydrolase family protein [Chitinispirillia bacterium]